jgi:hypothetical protein
MYGITTMNPLVLLMYTNSKDNKIIKKKKLVNSQMRVAHAYNPTSLGG